MEIVTALILGFIIAKSAGTKSIVKTKAKIAALAVASPSVFIGTTAEILSEAKPTAVVREVRSKAKKFLLTRRILAKVLDNMGQSYDILDNINTLQETLTSGDYDLLFADGTLITESIINDHGNIAIIASTDTNNPQEVSVILGENIANTASKEEIENIIKKYRG